MGKLYVNSLDHSSVQDLDFLLLSVSARDSQSEPIINAVEEALGNCQLRIVTSVQDALDEARRKPAQIILFDIPHHGLLSELASFLEHFPKIPVIALSSSADRDLKSRAFLAGVQDFVSQEEIKSYFLPRIIQHSMARKQFENSLLQRTNELYLKICELEESVERRTRDLSRSENQYRSLVQAAPLAITRIDLNGNILYANPEVCVLLGCSVEEAVGLNLRDLLCSEDYAKLPRFFPLGKGARADVNRHTLRIIKKNGQMCWCKVMLCSVGESDAAFTDYICIIDDITEVKQKERLEQLKTIAEEANRAKTDFLTGISHEIRTPLAAVTGFVDMALESKSPAEQQDYLKIIKRNSKHLFSLVNDLLDLSKIEAGQLDVNIGEFSLIDEIETVVSIAQNSAQEKGLSIHLNYHDPLPIHIYTDAQKLRQILINLLTNGIKYTDAGSVTLDISVSRGSGTTESQLIVKVEDTGSGIEAKFFEQLFLPFSRGENTKSVSKDGLGVGLVLSRNLARRLGGDVSLVKTDETGSIFQLVLSVGDLSQVKFASVASLVRIQDFVEKETNGLINGLGGLRLLVAEDAPDLQILVRYYLEKHGASVDVCGDGIAVMEIAERQKYDCILMDIQMPHLRGDQATRKLRENGYSGRIVALTAHAFHEERAQCLECGFDGFLTKPVLERDLIATVRQLIGSRPKAANNDALYSDYADDPVIKQFAPIFLENLSDSVASLNFEIVRSNWDQVSKIAHKIKGSSSCYGYPAIAKIASSLEEEARSGFRKDLALPFVESLARLAEKAKVSINPLH